MSSLVFTMGQLQAAFVKSNTWTAIKAKRDAYKQKFIQNISNDNYSFCDCGLFFNQNVFSQMAVDIAKNQCNKLCTSTAVALDYEEEFDLELDE
jgi:hypothetical protein